MEQRLFEDLIDSDVVKHRTSQSTVLPLSIAIHFVIVALVIVVPILTSQELPDPTSVVRAFFVEPSAPPPPPPPPPPPAARPAVVPRVQQNVTASANTFVAPVDIPDEIKPDNSMDDLGVDGGVAGGVEGGVAGGVVGGVVGGLGAAPPPVAAVRVGGQIKPPKKLRDVAPVYPPIARQARIQGTVTVECVISPHGRVMDVKVVSSIPLLDSAAVEAVKQWVYTPTLLNGVPVPVIMTVTVNFKIS
jgi:periplasmic protein TonB